MRKLALLLTAALAAAGCSSLLTRPEEDGRQVEVFTSGAPSRPFTKVSQLDLYVEKSTSGNPSIEDVLPELKRRARRSGADAVTDVRWSLRGTAELGVYHVTATGIAYAKGITQPAPAEGASGQAAPSAPATQGEASPSPARPGRAGGEIEIVTGGAPSRPFKEVSHLDLYVDKRGPSEAPLDDVLPEIRRQARLSGAEAVMDVRWTLRGTAEAGVYHVTATGIVYPEAEPGAKPAPVDVAPSRAPSAPATPAAGPTGR